MQVTLLESQLKDTTAEASACQDSNCTADAAEGKALPLLAKAKQLEDQVNAPVYMADEPVTTRVSHSGKPKARTNSLMPWWFLCSTQQLR